MKFPRTIRLDVSDTKAFSRVAEPGEWAVPGSFTFMEEALEELTGKDQLAFKNAWLGTKSFGFSSLVEVAEIDQAAFDGVVDRLAHHFIESFGAPSLEDAMPAAREEAEYAAGLCEYKTHTLLSIERDLTDDGEIVERFRVITPQRAQDHTNIWSIEPDDDAHEDD